MHDVNILPSLSLARFFLIQPLMYNNKFEKNNVSLDIFVSDTSIVRSLHLPGLEKKHSYKDSYSFLHQISVFGLLKIKVST